MQQAEYVVGKELRELLYFKCAYPKRCMYTLRIYIHNMQFALLTSSPHDQLGTFPNLLHFLLRRFQAMESLTSKREVKHCYSIYKYIN